jgi:hypothetical protein
MIVQLSKQGRTPMTEVFVEGGNRDGATPRWGGRALERRRASVGETARFTIEQN